MMEEITNVMSGRASITPAIVKRVLDYFHTTNNEPVIALSHDELFMLRCFARGYSPKQIINDFFMSNTEVPKIVQNLYSKMHRKQHLR